MKNPLLPFFVVLFVAALPTVSSAQESGVGTITFTMEGPAESPNVTGKWTLIRPGNTRTEGDDAAFAFSELPAGIYTFLTTLPEGSSAAITVTRNGVFVETLPRPQVSLTVADNDEFMLEITYTYTRSGSVSVTSDPQGLAFTLKGPNGIVRTGITPASYEGYPEGQYTAYFDEIAGCPKLPPKSGRLLKASRVALSTSIICDHFKGETGQPEQKDLEFVSLTIDGKTVTYADVRTNAWFAPYFAIVARTGILTGYSDASGNKTGSFGPGDVVTVAQLSKIAHKVSRTDEEKIRTEVINPRARNQWFERFFASAEQRWWEVWQDRSVDPERFVTRGEFIATVLRALGTPTMWPDGKLFSDLLPTYRYAAAVETAALDGLIDQGGTFRPNDPINRAEAAKIIAKAMDLYIEDTAEIQGGSY